MNYKKIYFSLIRKRKKEVLIEGYKENHHIRPKSFGGSNKKSNLVYLTAREHFIAHYLLTKIFIKNKNRKYKSVHALLMMKVVSNNQIRYNSKIYSKTRRLFSKVQSLSQSGKGNSQFGTMWITNCKENRKIKKENKIPNGWKKGTAVKFINIEKRKKLFLKKKRKEKVISLEKINYYRELYKIYNEKGWKGIQELGTYKYSKQNFVITCCKLLKEFKPQNGKKRGK